METILMTTALTPALSPRRGSAIAVAVQSMPAAAFENFPNAARIVREPNGFTALPLLRERAGVRADHLRPTNSLQNFPRIHHV